MYVKGAASEPVRDGGGAFTGAGFAGAAGAGFAGAGFGAGAPGAAARLRTSSVRSLVWKITYLTLSICRC